MEPNRPFTPMDDASEYVFEGGTSADCDRFIRWVRKTTQKNGKRKDNDWIIELVEMSLGGEALRWHSHLDEEIANDWPKLLRALLDHYSDGDDYTLPTPASAPEAPLPPLPSGAVEPAVSGGWVGHIRVIGDESLGRYLSDQVSDVGSLLLCRDVSDALAVSYTPSSRPTVLRAMAPSGKLQYVAAQQRFEADVGKDLPGAFRFVLVDADKPRTDRGSKALSDLKPQTHVWSIRNSTDVIGCVWANKDGRHATSNIVAQWRIGETISFAMTGDIQLVRKGSHTPISEARLLFEPV